jgi:hypothetical protein
MSMICKYCNKEYKKHVPLFNAHVLKCREADKLKRALELKTQQTEIVSDIEEKTSTSEKLPNKAQANGLPTESNVSQKEPSNHMKCIYCGEEYKKKIEFYQAHLIK